MKHKTLKSERQATITRLLEERLLRSDSISELRDGFKILERDEGAIERLASQDRNSFVRLAATVRLLRKRVLGDKEKPTSSQLDSE